MEFLFKILSARIPFDPDLGFCYVDVQDVVQALIAAAHSGRIGERYIIANSASTSSSELFLLAREIDPTIEIPKKISKFSFWTLAAIMELTSFFTHKRPELTRSMLKVYWRKKLTLDISRTQEDLGFLPKPPYQVIKDAIHYLKQNWLKTSPA
jgi:dihydroflavonol-4-reductase